MLLMFGVVSQRINAQTVAEPDTTQPMLMWQHPVFAATVSGVFLAGSSTLFFEPSLRQNHLVREEVQMWRRDHHDFGSFKLDDYILLMPIAAVEGLDLMGVPSRHSGWPLLHRTATTIVMVTAVSRCLKIGVHEWRPDHSATNSFPSGHTGLAFSGAELLRLEYGNTSPWIPAAGYTVALATGALRIYNDRHWMGDVLAGVAIGVVSADFSYWLNGKLETFFAPRIHKK